jgi:HSP20 family protein
MNVDQPTIRVNVGSRPRESAPPEAGQQGPEAIRETYTPPIDIHEGPEGLVLEADLPGATEQGLHIQLEENVLNLYARIEPLAPQGGRLVHEEFRPGDYHRSFILSDEVDRERITAELKNGVLRLLLPKADRARTRRIEIKSPDVATSKGGGE